MDKGIVVAATHHVEWMLPWWWMNYQAHNDLPVLFVDFGLTDKAKHWCAARGTLISLSISDAFVKDKCKVNHTLASKWEEILGSGLWDVRIKWFKKPFAFLQTPFVTSLWIDVDCEVRDSLSPLFPYADNPLGIALAREPQSLQKGFRALHFTLPEEVVYNSGVVVFQKEAPILNRWAQEVKKNNELYIGDQEALSRLLFHEKDSFKELPPLYNWDRGLGPNKDALIFHWHGQKGKQMVQKQMQALSSLGFVDFSM